jgi:glycosyltransferase involved in cell wall biosynthesis
VQQAPITLSVVIPAFNEEGNIGKTISEACAVGQELCDDFEVIIVDDGSTDRTSELILDAARLDPRVKLMRHETNRGYGEALRTGLRAATMDLVFCTDADNQFDMWELRGFLPLIDRADVVAGYRIKRQDALGRRISAKAWNQIVRALLYVPVRDIDCAFKLFRRSTLERIDVESVGAMVNTELMVKLGRSGAGVIERGVTHYPRTAGKARGNHPRVIIRALYELGSMYRRLSDLDSTAHSSA